MISLLVVEIVYSTRDILGPWKLKSSAIYELKDKSQGYYLRCPRYLFRRYVVLEEEEEYRRQYRRLVPTKEFLQALLVCSTQASQHKK